MIPLKFNPDSLFFKMYLTFYYTLPTNSCDLIKRSIIFLLIAIPLGIYSLPLILLAQNKKVRQFIDEFFWKSSTPYPIHIPMYTLLSTILYLVSYLAFSLLFFFYIAITDWHITTLDHNSLAYATVIIGLLVFTGLLLCFSYTVLYQFFKRLSEKKCQKKNQKKVKSTNHLKLLANSIKEKSCFPIEYTKESPDVKL